MANVNNLPQVRSSAMETAVLPPPATQGSAQAAAPGRRSFKTFVDAMDDFSFDRRDVAGMRQMLAMQRENEQAAQQAQKSAAQQGAVLRSFAPDQGQPEIPVVRGPSPPAQDQAQAQAQSTKPHSVYDPYAVLPKKPVAPVATPAQDPRAVQSSGLPQLPGFAAQASAPTHAPTHAPTVATTSAGDVPMLVIDPAKINPAAGSIRGERIIGYMPINGTNATPAAASAADESLPPALRSPLVDQVRTATRNGAPPGLSEEAMARMNAAAARKRALAPPMPPQLMAQEARWDRDAWAASVNGKPSTLPSLPQQAPPPAAMAQQANVLPRLPSLQ